MTGGSNAALFSVFLFYGFLCCVLHVHRGPWLCRHKHKPAYAFVQPVIYMANSLVLEGVPCDANLNVIWQVAGWV